MSEGEFRMWRESAEAYEKRTLDVERFESLAEKIRAQAHSELAQVAQLGHVAVPTDDAYWLLDLARDGIKFPAERRRAIDAETRLIAVLANAGKGKA